MRRVFWPLLLIWAVMLGAIMFIAFNARAFAPQQHQHGEGDWIRQGGYTGRGGASCCAPGRDCVPLPTGSVYDVPHGWVVTFEGRMHRFMEGQSGVYPSKDRDNWLCRTPSGEPRCFFPRGGEV